MIKSLRLFVPLLIFFFIFCKNTRNSQYQGKPFHDDRHTSGAQIIPGKIQCEYFDLGGEGIAYHDTDSTNSGSGGLNPADGSFLNEFRMNEGVDISYTKIDDREIDNNPFNFVEPDKDQLYVGWTEPGEWIKYTIDVQESGLYTVGLMYTSNRGGKISLAINDVDVSGPIAITSTFDKADTVAWRQWHHWNVMANCAEIHLEKGLNILTLTVVSEGNMNFDYLEFTRKK